MIVLESWSPCFYRLTDVPPAGLRAWLCSCGVGEVDSAGYRFAGDHPPQRGRSICQLSLAGEGFVRFRGVERSVPAGCALLLQPPDDHCYYAKEGVRWRFAFLTMDGPDAAVYWRDLLARVGPVLPLEQPALDLFVRILEARLAAVAPSDAWIDGLDAYALALALQRQIDAQGEPDAEAQALRRVEHHIERHLAAELDVDGLASIAGMSRAHFSRQFRARTGLPPAAYVARARMERASHLLRATIDPIAEVAAAVGMTDANHFARRFRQALGCSPSAYRRSVAP